MNKMDLLVEKIWQDSDIKNHCPFISKNDKGCYCSKIKSNENYRKCNYYEN